MLKGEMDPKLKEMCRRNKNYLKNEVDKLKDKKQHKIRVSTRK